MIKNKILSHDPPSPLSIGPEAQTTMRDINYVPINIASAQAGGPFVTDKISSSVKIPVLVIIVVLVVLFLVVIGHLSTGSKKTSTEDPATVKARIDEQKRQIAERKQLSRSDVATVIKTNQPSQTPLVTNRPILSGEVTQFSTIITSSINYEVLLEDKQGSTTRVKIFTLSKESSTLIQLNDILLSKYRPGMTHINIEYFDDKVVATDYFQKISDDTISEEEKDRLYSHYIASMTYNTTTGYKKLVKQGQSQEVLKEY